MQQHAASAPAQNLPGWNTCLHTGGSYYNIWCWLQQWHPITYFTLQQQYFGSDNVITRKCVEKCWVAETDTTFTLLQRNCPIKMILKILIYGKNVT